MMNALFVDRDNLKVLTGYTFHSAQARWLRKNGWRYTVNALGHPLVAMAELNRRLVGGTVSTEFQPNWDDWNGKATQQR